MELYILLVNTFLAMEQRGIYYPGCSVLKVSHPQHIGWTYVGRFFPTFCQNFMQNPRPLLFHSPGQAVAVLSQACSCEASPVQVPPLDSVVSLDLVWLWVPAPPHVTLHVLQAPQLPQTQLTERMDLKLISVKLRPSVIWNVERAIFTQLRLNHISLFLPNFSM